MEHERAPRRDSDEGTEERVEEQLQQDSEDEWRVCEGDGHR